MRPTRGARDRLSVEAPIVWVVVFRTASRAEGERRHRGPRAVVRRSSNDGETRSAVGAVQEGITVTPIGRVEEFGKAVRAGRGIG